SSAPFSGAHQIPGSVAYSFTTPWSYSILPCETRDTDETNPANQDGYGNPFQCVELVIRYTSIRYGVSFDDWIQAGARDAYTFFGSHPPQFTAIGYNPNGSGSVPRVGDIMVWGQYKDPATQVLWDTEGHVSIVTAVNLTQKKVTVMDENAYTT